MSVDAVVFDLGNVLVRWDPRQPFVGRMDPADVDAFFDEVDFPAFNQRQDAGRSWADARASLVARSPQHVPALDLYIEHFADSLVGPVPGSEQLVRDLVAAGVRTFGLTNWSAETFHHAAPAAPAIALLEDVLVSGSVQLAKPDPRIFRLLIDRFGLAPARTVFTDDVARNVDAAALCGLQGVQFASADALRADLRARGIPLPPA